MVTIYTFELEKDSVNYRKIKINYHIDRVRTLSAQKKTFFSDNKGLIMLPTFASMCTVNV